MKIAAVLVGFVVTVMFIYGAWQIARKWNYALGYESMVRGTVCEMVKPEYLKQPCDGGSEQ